jgi:hypothetical protein
MQNPEILIFFEKIFTWASALIAVLSVLILVLSAIRSGTIGKVKFGSISIEGRISDADIKQIESAPPSESQPFDIKALASYYNQALSRANISFWFSLIFAAIGFGVLIFAFITHSSSDIYGTVMKVISGTVIDAVSALFFVQSTSAQKSMSDFFVNLRLDRLNAEAREMIGEIDNVERRDQLRSQLILKYSGIDKLIVNQ